jgi:hypothetical protein
VNLLVLVVDDEPDVEVLFRQLFRHDLRAGRFTLDFAQSAPWHFGALTMQALEGGAEALLTKPIDFVMLRSEIDTRVERTA